MKNTLFCITCLAAFLMINPSYAEDTEETSCTDVLPVLKNVSDSQNIVNLLKAFADYKDHSPPLLSSRNGRYEICGGNITITIKQAIIKAVKSEFPDFDGTFVIKQGNGDNVLVSGLKIVVIDGVPGNKPLIEAVRLSSAGSLTLNQIDLVGVDTGLEMAGDYKIDVTESVIPNIRVKSDKLSLAPTILDISENGPVDEQAGS